MSGMTLVMALLGGTLGKVIRCLPSRNQEAKMARGGLLLLLGIPVPLLLMILWAFGWLH